MGRNLNPDRLLACKGTDCHVFDEKKRDKVRKRHPFKELIAWPVESKSYYCIDCYNKKRKEKTDRLRLEETIKKLFSIPVVTNLMNSQIKKYREQDGWSYEDIRIALEYFAMQPKSNFSKLTLGIVPHVIGAAKDFQKLQEERKEKINELSFEEEVVKKVQVDMIGSLENRSKNKKSYREQQLIKMEDFIYEL